VTGQVYNVTALTFTEGKTAKWYLQHAGGTSDAANRKDIFVIRANGSVIGRNSSEDSSIPASSPQSSIRATWLSCRRR
jgi:protein involved in polysaccharide export with SLBB domain